MSILRAKAAPTVVLDVSVTVQVADVPEQPPPDQPEKVEPLCGEAVKVTCVPEDRLVDVQVEPQLMPPAELVTMPVPEPDLVTDKV